MTYRPPLKDIKFLMDTVCDLGALEQTSKYSDVLSDDLVDAVLDGAGRLTADVLAP